MVTSPPSAPPTTGFKLSRSQSFTSSSARYPAQPSPSLIRSTSLKSTTSHPHSRSTSSNSDEGQSEPAPAPYVRKHRSTKSMSAIAILAVGEQAGPDDEGADMISGVVELDGSPKPRRMRRSDTLPSFPPPKPAEAQARRLKVEDLPENPKIWTPSQVAIYLAHALKLIPQPVIDDLSRYVTDEARIGGRVFLRLREDDLIEMGVNERWRGILLDAVQNLRKDVLKGRIFGFGSPAPAAPATISEGTLKPRASLSSFSSASSESTSPPGSPKYARASLPRHPGRVKGLVSAFETGSISSCSEDDDDERPPSSSRQGSPRRSLPALLEELEATPRKEGALGSEDGQIEGERTPVGTLKQHKAERSASSASSASSESSASTAPPTSDDGPSMTPAIFVAGPDAAPIPEHMSQILSHASPYSSLKPSRLSPDQLRSFSRAGGKKDLAASARSFSRAAGRDLAASFSRASGKKGRAGELAFSSDEEDEDETDDSASIVVDYDPAAGWARDSDDEDGERITTMRKVPGTGTQETVQPPRRLGGLFEQPEPAETARSLAPKDDAPPAVEDAVVVTKAQDVEKEKAAEPVEEPPKAPDPIAAPDTDLVSSLRSRLAELETQLAALKATPPDPATPKEKKKENKDKWLFSVPTLRRLPAFVFLCGVGVTVTVALSFAKFARSWRARR